MGEREHHRAQLAVVRIERNLGAVRGAVYGAGGAADGKLTAVPPQSQ